MRTTPGPGGEGQLAVIGQGTWVMGEDPSRRAAEVDALRLGISLGMTVINTAEFYAGGGAERLIGEAVRDCRDRVFLVTKVWPSHAGRHEAVAALAASLRRLGTDRVDAVLLHWPTRAVPLAETLAAFRDMIGGGMTRYVGVSNFSGPWLDLLDRSATAEDRIAFHEVPYSVADRRAERGVLPYAAAHGQLVLAYSPLGHGRSHRWSGLGVLAEIGRARGLTPQQVALAWTVRRPGVVAIPKAVDPAHVRANAAAGDVVLTAAELDRIEAAFPPAARDLRPALPPIGALHRLAMSWSRRAFRQDATS